MTLGGGGGEIMVTVALAVVDALVLVNPMAVRLVPLAIRSNRHWGRGVLAEPVSIGEVKEVKEVQDMT
jgi:hypothetical protein